MLRERLTILLSGMIAADPFQGGATWAVLQYLLGFQQLGHDVVLVEPVQPASLRPAGAALAYSENAAYFRSVSEAFGLGERSGLLLAGTRETVGLPYDQIRAAAGRSDLLVNISGMLQDEELLAPIPRRAFLDLDPGFVQLWHATQGVDMRLDAHNHFVTIGLNIGRPDCAVPTCGRKWITTTQPVVLRHWPAADRVIDDALTTVANWRGYGSIVHDGVSYGQKAHSLRSLMTLPTRTSEVFLLALSIHPTERQDLHALAANRWRLVDPACVAGTPGDYQRFIQGSKAEFGLAKSGYVNARCGWFSDRSVAYMASGRPVIAQETGFGRYFPTGEGLFSFETAEDVLASLELLNRDYTRHSRAARGIARAFFDSDAVLSGLLDALGAH
jgi:hypothetical protein